MPSVPQLRKRAKSLGLSPFGNKSQLQKRIASSRKSSASSRKSSASSRKSSASSRARPAGKPRSASKAGSINHLRAQAKRLGISAAGSKAALQARIRGSSAASSPASSVASSPASSVASSPASAVSHTHPAKKHQSMQQQMRRKSAQRSARLAQAHRVSPAGRKQAQLRRRQQSKSARQRRNMLQIGSIKRKSQASRSPQQRRRLSQHQRKKSQAQAHRKKSEAQAERKKSQAQAQRKRSHAQAQRKKSQAQFKDAQQGPAQNVVPSSPGYFARAKGALGSLWGRNR